MFSKLLPDWVVSGICRLTPKWLAEQGVSAVLTDLDNTLTGYRGYSPDKDVAEWIRSMKENNIGLMIISNNHSHERVAGFAEPLDIPYISKGGKPGTDSLLRALKTLAVNPENAIMAGDQVFIDILAGNRAGVRTVLVEPYNMNFLFYLRRICETPFIRLSKKKQKR
ncbi:MAG: YqeG family HAD IIIA-type phosphatase [Oscillospiraceae bacterium]|nr:YqeG family HAD IIIA-type phosphatase [Oscillospiraceae bacterium]